MLRKSVAVLCAVLAFTSARAAFAQTTAAKKKLGLSRYEQDTLDMALKQLRLDIDPSPNGKIVEAIDTAPMEVFDDREGFFQALNIFHATTKGSVLRREALLRVGQVWDSDLADETARNLRTYAQLSLVLVVPVKSSKPGAVRMLVVTKDVWSLRLSWDVKASGKGLDTLKLEPTETNLGGTFQSASTLFVLRPDRYTLGVSYRVPRLQGQWLAVGLGANTLINRESGKLEGSYGYTYATRPLFSAREKWSWLVSNDWRNEIVRRITDTRVAPYRPVFDRNIEVPDTYHAERFTETVAVTRSFGLTEKQEVTLGGEINRRTYRLNDDVIGRYPQAALEEYQRIRMPVSDTRVGPALRMRFYRNVFKRVLDLETIGLQEDVRLGYDFTLKGYPVFKGLGSTRDFIGTFASAQYTWALEDGFIRVSGELQNELEQERIADGSVFGNLRVHSPSTGYGRLVFDAVAMNRYRNSLNRLTTLGGDGRMRGYPTGFITGKDYVSFNTEYRTPSFKILTVLLAAAAFYDVGGAFNGFDHERTFSSAGGGFRILFPQLDKVVFRGDLGVPLLERRVAGVSKFDFFVAFEQAFGLLTTGAAVGPTLATGQGLLAQ